MRRLTGMGGVASRGQSLVEFVLVIPVFLLMLSGIIDFGRATFYSVQVVNAAREGARMAALPDRICNTVVTTGSTCATSTGTGPSVCSSITADLAAVGAANVTCTEGGALSAVPAANNAYVQVDAYSASGTPCSGAPGNSTSTTRATPRTGGNQAIAVTIRYYYRPITPLISSLFPTNFYLGSTACARGEV
jgi:Flp pilus assembly protein TadG